MTTMWLTRERRSPPPEAAAPPAGITARAMSRSSDKTSRRRNITDLPARTLHFVPPAGWPLGTWPVNAIPGAYSGTTSTSASPPAAHLRDAADPGPARRAVRGEQAAALHRGRLRPGGLGAQDLVRRGHPAAGRAAAGQPQRRPRRREGHVGEVLQQ